jgi:hypothetical protein
MTWFTREHGIETVRMARSRQEYLTQNLSFIPIIWLAGLCVETFNLEDPAILNLPGYLEQLEDVEYFSVSYTQADIVQKIVPGESSGTPNIDPRLVKG